MSEAKVVVLTELDGDCLLYREELDDDFEPFGVCEIKSRAEDDDDRCCGVGSPGCELPVLLKAGW